MEILKMISDAQVSIVVALVIKLLVFIVIAFYIIPKQLREVFRPKDGLTVLRWQILVLLSVSVFTSIPSAMYQIQRFIDPSNAGLEVLRGVATITNNISSLIIIVLLVLIFNYKNRG